MRTKVVKGVEGVSQYEGPASWIETCPDHKDAGGLATRVELNQIESSFYPTPLSRCGSVHLKNSPSARMDISANKSSDAGWPTLWGLRRRIP